MEIYSITSLDGKMITNKLFETMKEAEDCIKDNKLNNVKVTPINSVYKDDGKRYPIIDFDKITGKIKLAPFSIPSDAEI